MHGKIRQVKPRNSSSQTSSSREKSRVHICQHLPWRAAAEREREKKIKTDCLVTLVCVSICTQSLPRLFSVVAVLDADVCGVWGDFFFSEVDRKCVTLRRVKAWSPCWLLCGDWTWWGFRIIISSQCVLYVGELSLRSSWDFLVLNDQRWPLLSSHSKMNPHFTSELFPTDNKLLASGEIHSSSSIGNYTFDTTGNDKVITL